MVYAFFISHWLLCVLMQSLFLHRYAPHQAALRGLRP
jgi:stearoyl-CoA desaturase (delta-9 desaturase)